MLSFCLLLSFLWPIQQVIPTSVPSPLWQEDLKVELRSEPFSKINLVDLQYPLLEVPVLSLMKKGHLIISHKETHFHRLSRNFLSHNNRHQHKFLIPTICNMIMKLQGNLHYPSLVPVLSINNVGLYQISSNTLLLHLPHLFLLLNDLCSSHSNLFLVIWSVTVKLRKDCQLFVVHLHRSCFSTRVIFTYSAFNTEWFKTWIIWWIHRYSLFIRWWVTFSLIPSFSTCFAMCPITPILWLREYGMIWCHWWAESYKWEVPKTF